MTKSEFETLSKNIADILLSTERILLKDGLDFERTKITEKLIEAGMWAKMAWDQVRTKDLKAEMRIRE